MPAISPFLWFDNDAEQAMKFYLSIFKGGKVLSVSRMGPGKKAKVMGVSFRILGQTFHGLNGGPHFKFNEAVSMYVSCKTQKEVDYYWKKLTSGGGSESRCGWLKDKFGLSWQIASRSREGAKGHAGHAGNGEDRYRRAEAGRGRQIRADAKEGTMAARKGTAGKATKGPMAKGRVKGGATVEGYLGALPEDKRAGLAKLRRTLKRLLPKAEECISYGIPAFRNPEGVIVYYAAMKSHLSFFPTSYPIEVCAQELKGYATSRGTIRFPIDAPLPAALVAKLVKIRLRQMAEKPPARPR